MLNEMAVEQVYDSTDYWEVDSEEGISYLFWRLLSSFFFFFWVDWKSILTLHVVQGKKKGEVKRHPQRAEILYGRGK